MGLTSKGSPWRAIASLCMVVRCGRDTAYWLASRVHYYCSRQPSIPSRTFLLVPTVARPVPAVPLASGCGNYVNYRQIMNLFLNPAHPGWIHASLVHCWLHRYICIILQLCFISPLFPPIEVYMPLPSHSLLCSCLSRLRLLKLRFFWIGVWLRHSWNTSF